MFVHCVFVAVDFLTYIYNELIVNKEDKLNCFGFTNIQTAEDEIKVRNVNKGFQMLVT